MNNMKNIVMLIPPDALKDSFKINEETLNEHNARIIEAPGFDDNIFEENHYRKFFEQIYLHSIKSETFPIREIEAFVLVVKLNPKAQTLKEDLERMKILFGSVSMKSLILLVICQDDKKSKQNFLDRLIEMDEIIKILEDEKLEEPNENWYCVWNNDNSSLAQENEFFKKITKLEPYTLQKLNESEQETRERIQIFFQKKLHRELMKIQSQAYQHHNEKDSHIGLDQIIDKFEKSKSNFLKERRRIQEKIEETEFLVQIVNEQAKPFSEIFRGNIINEREEIAQNYLNQIKTKQQEYQEKFDYHLKQNKELIESFKESVKKSDEEEKEMNVQKSEQKVSKEVTNDTSKGGNINGEVVKRRKVILQEGAKEGAKSAAKEAAKEATKKLVLNFVKLAAPKMCNIF